MIRIIAFLVTFGIGLGVSFGQEWKCVKTIEIGGNNVFFNKEETSFFIVSNNVQKFSISNFEKINEYNNEDLSSSSYGKYIINQNKIVVSADKKVLFLNDSTLELLESIITENKIDLIAFNSVTNRIACGVYYKGIFEIYDLGLKNKLFTKNGHKFALNSIEFSQDGTKILTTSDLDSKIWDLQKLEQDFEINSYRTYYGFFGLRKKIYVVSNEGEIKHFNSENLIGGFKQENRKIKVVKFFDNDTKIISGNNFGEIFIYDNITKKQIFKLDGGGTEIKDFCTSNNGKFLISITKSQTKIWKYVLSQEEETRIALEKKKEIERKAADSVLKQQYEILRISKIKQNSNPKLWKPSDLLCTHKGDYWAGEFKGFTEDKKQIKLKVYYEDASQKPEIKLFIPANFHKCLEEEEQELRGFITARQQYEEQKRQEAAEAKRIALEQKQEEARQAQERARERATQLANEARMRNASNKANWKLGNKLCNDINNGVVVTTLQRFNEDKSMAEVKIVTGPGGKYNGESIEKGNSIWVNTKGDGWHLCFESEKQNSLANDKSEKKQEYSTPSYSAPKDDRCSKCGGRGVCLTCNGRGYLNSRCTFHDTDGDGYCTSCNNTGNASCYNCNKSGKCGRCGGTGRK